MRWLTLAIPAAGSFLAAWLGARLAFRRTLRELALTGKVAWYTEAIRSLSQYEEALDRLRSNWLNSAVIKKQGAVPQSFTPEADRWAALVEAERAARSALQLFEVYTSGKLRIECSVTLDHTARIAVGQWYDLGPAPKVLASDLANRSLVAGVRRKLQAELRRTLQVDGWWRAAVPWLDKRLILWDLNRLRKQAKRSQEKAVPPAAS